MTASLNIIQTLLQPTVRTAVSVSPLLHPCRLTNVSRPLSITGRSRCIIMSFSIAVLQRQRVVHEKLCLLGQVAFTGIVGLVFRC